MKPRWRWWLFCLAVRFNCLGVLGWCVRPWDVGEGAVCGEGEPF